MWAIVKKTSDKQAITVKPLKNRKGWKTIRIFVSSTFKDFHEEREVLVKEVFPDLRLWCEQRKLRLVECDLRWVGVLLSIIIAKKTCFNHFKTIHTKIWRPIRDLDYIFLGIIK